MRAILFPVIMQVSAWAKLNVASIDVFVKVLYDLCITICLIAWVADSTIAPFAYKAAKTLTTYNMGGYDAVSMGYAKNADLLVGATAGIAIGEVPITLGGGKNITFYSAAQPTAQVQIVVYLETIAVQGID